MQKVSLKKGSFKYWFAHWCAFQNTAIGLGVWKPKHLLHDLDKPFLSLIWPYKEVHDWHRLHSKHHIEYFKYSDYHELDIDSWIVDNQCYGAGGIKPEPHMNAREYAELKYAEEKKAWDESWDYYPHEVDPLEWKNTRYMEVYRKILKRLDELGL